MISFILLRRQLPSEPQQRKPWRGYGQSRQFGEWVHMGFGSGSG